jgi:hypothetical protein
MSTLRDVERVSGLIPHNPSRISAASERVQLNADSRPRAVLADLSRSLPLPAIDDQVVPTFCATPSRGCAHLQRSFDTADPMHTGSGRPAAIVCHACASARRSIS